LSSSNYSDDTQKVRKKGSPYTHRTSREAKVYWPRSVQPYATHSINKNPLNPHKNGSNLDTKQWYSSTRSGAGNLSYFPDQVARVSYVASIVEIDPDGNYLVDLQDGMDLLATRLAPSFFPGTVVRGVTTQVDGYFPATCPTEKYTNCQDVTASIGIYLNPIPIEVNETEFPTSGNYNSYDTDKNNLGGNLLVDPSTMTKELIAFQESFEAAIANNELQEAIQEEYRQKQNANSNPPVVIVTEFIDGIDAVADGGNSNDDDNGTVNDPSNDSSSLTDGSIDSDSDSDSDSSGIDDVSGNEIGGIDVSGNEIDDVSGSGSGNEIDGIDRSEDEASYQISSVPVTNGDTSADTRNVTTNVIHDTPTMSAILRGEEAEDGRKVGLATGGVIGTVLISLLLVSLLAMSRRKRRGKKESGTGSVVKKIKIKLDSPNRSPIRRHSYDEGHDQSGQILLQNVYLADSDSDDGDLEEGYTGSTMRTIEKEEISYDKRNLKEMLIPVVPSNYSGYSLGENVDAETTKTSDSNDSNRTVDNTVTLPPMECYHEEGIEARPATTNDGFILFSDNVQFDTYDDKYDEDDDNEYVMCEDDTSDSSIGEHLMSACKGSGRGLLTAKSSECSENSGNPTPSPTISPELPVRSTVAAAIPFPSPEVEKETIDSYISTWSTRYPQQSHAATSSVASSTNSNRSVGTMEEVRPLDELDLAIASGDWAAVGATAAALASRSVSPNQSSLSRRIKRDSVSSSSSSISEYTQKANELDKLIEAGDWEALVVTAAKYDAEGEDVSRSCRSAASTQGSETEGSHANDSYASHMDYSSVDRSTNTGRSVTTSASQKERMKEIREQVTQMVRDVVPDEVDNVDEMMAQFKGKEDELLETLRTMKERNVARKARQESQKIARRNTRSRDKTEGFFSVTSPTNPSSQDETINATEKVIGTEQPPQSRANIYDAIDHDATMSSTSVSLTTNGEERTDESEEQSVTQDIGSFFNATKVDPDQAAADAATWAIQRSLDELMEKDEKESSF